MGDRPPFHFFFGHGPRCKFEEKKLQLGPVAPHRATGGSFEIFQNGHIFLKFYFFNIKKKKARGGVGTHGPLLGSAPDDSRPVTATGARVLTDQQQIGQEASFSITKNKPSLADPISRL